MDPSPHIPPPADRPEPPDLDWRAFSLWCPAPLQRVYRRFRLADDAYELAGRRAGWVTAVAWLPLLALSVIDHRAYIGAKVPFLQDFDTQARILVALPLLVWGEVVIHRRMPATVRGFIDRHLVDGTARTAFDEATSRTLRLSRSTLAEILIVIGVATIGVKVGASIATIADSSWYASTVDGATALTPAGWWYVVVSRPLFQFVLLRWYYRFVLWDGFLWEVSRLRLHLAPAHPDHRAGLGFLFALSDAFAPFMFAHGTMLAGRVANGVIHGGQTLRSYEQELVSIPIVVLLFVVAPELEFAMPLWKVRRQGLREFGIFGQRYVRAFSRKWLHGPSPGADTLLGSPDIQSLADLANSFAIVEQIRVLPSRTTVAMLALFTLLPLAPLPLTVVPARELLERVVKMML
jgi:hypothetical protein